MTMGPGDELRIPVRLDVSQISDDLAAVDREVARLQQRMVSAFNRSAMVRRGRVDRASSIEDVGENRQAWTPELRSLDRQLNSRLQSIERAARRGETRPPLTPQQQARSEAQARLGQASGKPVEIDARSAFFDKMRQGLMRGLPTTVLSSSMGGVPGGASGAARLIMSLLGGADNPMVAGFAAASAGALAINAKQAAFQRQQAALSSALVGGPAFGDTRTLMGLGLAATAFGMNASVGEGQDVAGQLAAAGMRPKQLNDNVASVLGLSQAKQIKPEDLGGIVAALGTTGGMSNAGIARTLQDLSHLGDGANQSLLQLVSGVKTLSSVNTAAARDVYSLAAIQRSVGPTSGINAGQLMQGVMGATGANALQIAGFLGMSPDQFLAAQSGGKAGMAQIYDRFASRVRALPAGATGTFTAEMLLDQFGLGQGLNATQKATLVQRMRSAPPGQATAAATANIARTRQQRVSPAKFRQQEQQQGVVNQSLWDWLGNAWGLLTTQAANQPGVTPTYAPPGSPMLPSLLPPPGAAGGGGKSGLHTVSPALLSAVRAAATGNGPSGDVNHTVTIKVTVQDQRGRELGHAVDTTRVVAGARTTLRPPYDRPKAPVLDNPQPPGRWNEGWS